jgi:hypothetical protein
MMPTNPFTRGVVACGVVAGFAVAEFMVIMHAAVNAFSVWWDVWWRR